MIIKLERVISCTSENPDFPATNLLKSNPPAGPWKCEKPGILSADVILQLSEESCITGLDIGNHCCCIVIVTASTSAEPDNWVPIVNHQFLTHDEAANGKFKDQVQLFTKRELNSDTLKIKFSRVKVTCMQSANRRILFGLSFLVLRTEVVLDLGIDVLGRFKLKTEDKDKNKNDFKERYFRLFPEKKKDYKEEIKEKIKENGMNNFIKRAEEERTPKRRPLLEKLEAGKVEEVFGKNSSFVDQSLNGEEKEVKRTPFGDIIPDKKTPNGKRKNEDMPSTSKRRSTFLGSSDEEGEIKKVIKKEVNKGKRDDNNSNTKLTPQVKQSDGENSKKCTVCRDELQDRPCKKCHKLPKQLPVEAPQAKKPKIEKKSKKLFSQLFDDVSFSLSGYVNPQRDEIRRKALKMGAKYVADPNVTNNKCSHLICAFKNTPKSQQLKGHCKIVSHKFIEECFDKKKRFPWRRYALDKSDRKHPESEDEIEGTDSQSPPNPYDQETDPDSDSYY